MTALATTPTPVGRRSAGTWVVYQWELEKLTAQLRVRAAAVACFLAPFAFVAVLHAQDAMPADTLFGRWTHLTGFATPLVILTFSAQWGLPLLTCLVAGDIFASEDHYGTWKMVLTRSRGRGAVFAGKALAAATYTVVMVALLGMGSLAAGVLFVNHDPLVGLNGTLIPAGKASLLVLAAWASALLPALGFTALGLLFSIATRNGPAGIIGPTVVGLLMQLYSFVNGVDVIRHLLLTTPFSAWHGFFAATPYYGPLWEGALVCAVYLAGCGPVDITRAKLQDDFGPTFRNMYVLQQKLLGHTPQSVPARVSRAKCLKGGNGTPDEGPGDNWTCLVDWPAADGHIEGLTYEVDVKPEGCYTAQGPATYVGQQTMRAADGRSVTNPLFEFDGCLDTS